ncbi:MAG TPA: hypothetical protein VKB38_13885 [Terracidiphilus sp.]|nr:hypothetical protein [Terracidiphilus sp.]
MFSFRRFALVLAFAVAAAHVTVGQESSSSSNQAPETQQSQPQSGASQAGQAQPDQAQAPSTSDQGSQSVQARIRARREQRREAAIKDVYLHLYDLYVGMGYLRFVPGAGTNGEGLQRTTLYAWNVDFTRYYSERLGATLDARGYYGTTFTGLNFTNSVTKPAISTYAFMGGPQYRLLLHPRYSVAARVMGGYDHGHFSGDTNGFGSTPLGLWPDGGTFAASTAIIGELNLSPSFGLRLAPEYFFTGFGSDFQDSRGFTGGFVFRFGKQ